MKQPGSGREEHTQLLSLLFLTTILVLRIAVYVWFTYSQTFFLTVAERKPLAPISAL